MKPSRHLSRIALVALVLPFAAQAADLELSLSLGTGYPVKRNLYETQDLGGGASTFVQTQFKGPWVQGGAHVNYEVFKTGAWKFWAGAGYETDLGSPDFYKLGQSTTQATTSTTETLNGSASYSRYQFGLGTTLATGTLGEYGVYLWRRVNRLGLSGTLTTFNLQGGGTTTKDTSPTLHSNDSDFMLELTMGFTQARPTFKTFERISFGTAFGPAFGQVAASEWQLDKAYADRLRPTLEVSFAFGVRL